MAIAQAVMLKGHLRYENSFEDEALWQLNNIAEGDEASVNITLLRKRREACFFQGGRRWHVTLWRKVCCFNSK
jgi:hypothetical protein